MRLISRRHIIDFFTKHATAEAPLRAFVKEVEAADWQKLGDVIAYYPTADVITGKRFVFNIKGNHYRLIADIEFIKKLVFVVWIGTHAQYDKIDVKTIGYVKGNQK